MLLQHGETTVGSCWWHSKPTDTTGHGHLLLISMPDRRNSEAVPHLCCYNCRGASCTPGVSMLNSVCFSSAKLTASFSVSPSSQAAKMLTSTPPEGSIHSSSSSSSSMRSWPMCASCLHVCSSRQGNSCFWPHGEEGYAGQYPCEYTMRAQGCDLGSR